VRRHTGDGNEEMSGPGMTEAAEGSWREVVVFDGRGVVMWGQHDSASSDFWS
jgi:hypothetical protein